LLVSKAAVQNLPAEYGTLARAFLAPADDRPPLLLSSQIVISARPARVRSVAKAAFVISVGIFSQPIAPILYERLVDRERP
jgi:hypothetical protein